MKRFHRFVSANYHNPHSRICRQVNEKMKTSTVVMLGVAVALAIGLSSTLVYASMWNQYSYGQNPQNFGPQYQGYPPGMMGQGFTGRVMMGGYGDMMGPGMMSGGAMQAQCADYMRNYSYKNNWNYSKSPVVHIINYAFYPSSLTISKGTTVAWINMDTVPHTVTSGSEAAPTSLFDSHEMGHMQSFSFTFNTTGTYTYFCDLHLGMIGTITVTA